MPATPTLALPTIALPIRTALNREKQYAIAYFAAVSDDDPIGSGNSRYDAILDLLLQVEPAPVTR